MPRFPASERAAVPVVRAGVSGPVLWVAPLRADERARVTDASRVLLELAWEAKRRQRDSPLVSFLAPLPVCVRKGC